MHEVFTLDQQPRLGGQIDALSREAWPEFLLHGHARHWERLFDDFAPFQILFREADDQVIAAGHTIPLPWDGTVEDLPATIDAILVRAVEARQSGRACNTLCALAAMVRRPRRGAGLSVSLLREMRAVARRHGQTALLAPVRPTLKSRYPLAPFERYVRWTRPDGLPFDPWIRVHWNLGARPLAVALKAFSVTGTIAEWESWTAMRFPESGLYIVDGALQPVSMDLERNHGCYDDPNFWMRHPVE